MTFWTDERVEQLKHLHEKGRTASQIAVELGAPSRGTVCGKIDRLGLTREGKPRRAPARKRRPATNQFLRPKQATPEDLARAAEIEEAEIKKTRSSARLEAGPEPKPLRASILDLRHGECRWPHGDRDFTFCGHPVIENSSYCRHHTVRASAGRPKPPYVPREGVRRKTAEAAE